MGAENWEILIYELMDKKQPLLQRFYVPMQVIAVHLNVKYQQLGLTVDISEKIQDISWQILSKRWIEEWTFT